MKRFPAKKIIGLCLFAFIIANGCRQEQYYRTPSGLLFRVVSSDAKDSVAKMGNTVKLHYIQKAGDSVMENNYDKMPLYWMVMPEYGNKYNPLEIFNYEVREGDSVVIIQSIDSMVKKHIFEALPKYLKKTDQWTTYMKVERVFRNDSAAQIDKLMEQKAVDTAQKIAGDQRVRNYMKAHNVNAAKTDDGVYLEIISPGSGPQVEAGKKVGLRYVFNNLTSGKMFDTNTDPSFHRKDTLTFEVGGPYMIKNVDRALRSLKEGAHARIYIPTMTAFGGNPPRGPIHPYDDLMFEIWVLKVQ